MSERVDEVDEPRQDGPPVIRRGAGRPGAWPLRLGPLSIWVALVGSVTAVAGTAVGCWLQTSFVGWLTNLVGLAVLLLVVVGYDRPGRHLFRVPSGWFFPLCGAAGLASVARVRKLSMHHVSSVTMGAAVVTVVVLAFVLWGLREPGDSQVTSRLVFPLPTGRWVVASGGVAAFNHHLVAGAQSRDIHAPDTHTRDAQARYAETGALDLVAVRRDGSRAQGVCPTRLEAYEAYGQEVVSPCDGLVIAAVDGCPDQVPLRVRPAPPSGNHVRIDNGTEILHLAHLRAGSLQVTTGDRVVTGQLLAQVGNSGNTSEPHLHVHAERDGRGLRLRFADVGSRRLRPGVAIEVGKSHPDALGGRPST